jgi:NTE family protein
MRNEFEGSSSNITPPLFMIDDTPRPSFGLGLMGGGSWGAFTAGALEEILPTLETLGSVRAVSGTSAGAVNGALLTSGLNTAGAHEAVRRMNQLWQNIASNGHLLETTHNWTDLFLAQEDRWPNLPRHLFNIAAQLQTFQEAFTPRASSLTTRMISDMVAELAPDWSSVQSGRVQFSANTVQQHIRTGARKHIILSGSNLTPDGVAASAALKELGTHRISDRGNPEDHHCIYLDGGYAENPPIQPLLDENVTDIIMIILHDHHQSAPETSHGAKLYHEEIHTDITSLASSDANRARIHTIEIEMHSGQMNGWNLNNTSKLNTSPSFIQALHDAGRAAGKKWLAENMQFLGHQSSYRPHGHVMQDMLASGYTL